MPHKDPDQKRQYLREWRARNPDKQKAINTRAVDRERKYRQDHREQYAEYQRQSRKRNPRMHMVIAARYRAQRDGLPCDITVETVNWPIHCPVLGFELDYSTTQPGNRAIRNNYPTLDRRVNELGYVQGNVFVISHRANRIKSDASIAELEAIVAYAKGDFHAPSA